MRSRLLGLVLVLALIAAAGYGAADLLDDEFIAPGPAAQPMRITVAQGQPVRSVLRSMQAAGALASAWRTQVWLRLHGIALTIRAGAYEIPARASASDIVDMLEQGRVILEQITVVEGARFSDLRRLLETNPEVRSLLRGKSDAEVMTALGHPDTPAEGAFFPDTYRFAAGTTDIDILKLAYSEMQQALNQAWVQRASDLPFDTPQQALVLASMVEKETGLAAERPRIAGVFVARLRKGMRLQSDPTVIYGMGSTYDGSVHERDLTTDTPWNTYTRAGLPQTPIALPGRAALLAAVQPQETGDLYFVASGDGDGGHRFSATLAQHNAAVHHYLSQLHATAPATGTRQTQTQTHAAAEH